MVCVPDDSVEVVNAAWPAASTGTALASTVAPSRNVTVPAATGVPALTIAVKVTGWPESDGFCDEDTVVAVVTTDEDTTLLTTMLSPGEPPPAPPGPPP